MSIFTVRDNVPQITPEGLFIPEMKHIWDDDKSTNKSKATQVLAYIYHMADPRSVYHNIALDTREEQIIKDYIKDKDWEPNVIVVEAIKKYKVLSETPASRLLDIANDTADKMANFLKNMDFAAVDKLGKPKYPTNMIMSALEKLPKVVSAIQDQTIKVRKEQQTSNVNVRGQEKFNMFEE